MIFEIIFSISFVVLIFLFWTWIERRLDTLEFLTLKKRYPHYKQMIDDKKQREELFKMWRDRKK